MSWETTANIFSGFGIYVIIKMLFITPSTELHSFIALQIGFIALFIGCVINMFIDYKNKSMDAERMKIRKIAFILEGVGLFIVMVNSFIRFYNVTNSLFLFLIGTFIFFSGILLNLYNNYKNKKHKN